MSQRSAGLCPGELVEVKTPDEIAQTLDGDGALDHLPFMPEMLEFCGRRFRVSRKALTACISGPPSPLVFKPDDVVTLDDLRCSGAAHDGCQKACMIHWREAWLRKVDGTPVQSQADLRSMVQVRTRLKVKSGPETYYCQASELPKVAYAALSRGERLRRYLRGLRTGNFNILQMAQGTGTWLFWRLRQMFFGRHARGANKATPTESLNLQPGEWVEVKSLRSIMETLNENGRNRGLYFSPDMREWCGRRCRVKGRLDKIIVDGTGKMRQLPNTVRLVGSNCGCSYMGFDMGGCSRCEVTYWREIWLRRVDGPGDHRSSPQ